MRLVLHHRSGARSGRHPFARIRVPGATRSRRKIRNCERRAWQQSWRAEVSPWRHIPTAADAVYRDLAASAQPRLRRRIGMPFLKSHSG
jgi:hypothetical protein